MLILLLQFVGLEKTLSGMYTLTIPDAVLSLFKLVGAVDSEIHGHVEWYNFGYTHLRVDCRWHATLVLQVLLWYIGEVL